ncbi:MAG: M2 family metallopeptidase [Rubricoccaceae bacterium]
MHVLRFSSAPLRLIGLAGLVGLAGCSASTETLSISTIPESTESIETMTASNIREDADLFLDAYSRRYVPLYYASARAEWEANTRIVEGDSITASRVRTANQALADFTGSSDTIEKAQALLARRSDLRPLQARQLDAVLYAAAGNPETASDLVRQRIAAEAAQTETLYGYAFTLDGQEVTPNEIDAILRDSDDLDERLAYWEASKDVGPTLTPGLEQLRDLRNGVVQNLGYDDYFAYQVSDYGLTSDEMVEQMRRINNELRPLYRELHTWARYELADRYNQPVPEYLPAHWLPNRWGQDWSALVNVEGMDLDGALAEKGPEWVVEQAERFYVSLGFDEMPESFYTRSSLYPLEEGTPYKKNTHASAWHMDLNQDVRSLMSVEPNAEWYETTHHELGHIYYYLSYTNPNVPPMLREGANRAYHEAVGSLMGLASLQPRFLDEIGLVPESVSSTPDPIQGLLREALNYAVFIPFSSGTMTLFERDLYAEDLSPEEWNARWWQYVKEFQGIVPPDSGRAEIGSPYNDAATKTHINDDAAQYYDYALSNVLLFQLHDHIAREILNEDPRDTNYYGRTEVGDFLKQILTPGATVDGNELLRETTGSELTATPMLEYFAPLMEWLRVQNQGRDYTL